MKAALGEDILKIANMNGYVYGVPVEKEWYADSCLVMRKDILDKYNLDVSNVKSLADCAPIFETIHENEPDMKIIVGAKDGLIGNIYFADVLSDRFGVLDNGGADTTIVNYYETDNYKNLAATVHDYYEKGYIDKDMATSTETLFGNCLPLQFLYGQCVFFSTDRMEERKRITGSVCLEMWSRDTTRLLLHCKGEGFYFRTAFACPRKSCPKNHPSIGCIQIIVFQCPLCFRFISNT